MLIPLDKKVWVLRDRALVELFLLCHPGELEADVHAPLVLRLRRVGEAEDPAEELSK